MIVFAVFFAACNFTEEIYINENNSGKLTLNFDGTEFLSAIGSLDSLKNEEIIDSIIHFKDFLKEKSDPFLIYFRKSVSNFPILKLSCFAS